MPKKSRTFAPEKQKDRDSYNIEVKKRTYIKSIQKWNKTLSTDFGTKKST